MGAASGVELRGVEPTDLDAFFTMHQDPVARQMVGYSARNPYDRDAFDAHCVKILNDPNVVVRAIEVAGQLTGYIAHFDQLDRPSVSYWLDCAFWGQGIATAALEQFLKQIAMRPLYALVEPSNIRSIRVLEKCGFVPVDTLLGPVEGTDRSIEEYLMRLD